MSGMVSFQPKRRIVRGMIQQGFVLFVLFGMLMPCGVNAQNPKSVDQAAEQNGGNEKTWAFNFKETEIKELIRYVAKSLDKTIIIDPKVKGKVQVISSTPVNAKEMFDLFLSILEVHGYASVESGGVLRIIQSKDARTSPVPVVSTSVNRSASAMITQVIQLENISAAKLIPVLRPLAPQQAHMAAYAPSNAIIISDTAANIARIKAVIKKIDLSAVQKTEVVALKHASSEEVVRMLDELNRNEAAKGQAAAKKLVIVADNRTNSILISGDELERQRVKTLIRHIDTVLTQSGNVRVVYLKYAKAKDLSGVLTRVVQNMERMSSRNDKSSAKSAATIEADEGTNSLIITAEADAMQSLSVVIERLDIRRAQVLVEAIIVEMTDTNSRGLGVEWLFANNNGSYGSSGTGGVAGGLAKAVGSGGVDSNGNPVDVRNAIGGVLAGTVGQVLGVGRISDQLNFNVVLHAVQSDQEANILSTPSLLTLDNEEATIVVGENISFVTGSYTSTGTGGGSNPSSPFQTVKQKNVGITLKITPHINEGDSLILEIDQEVSSVNTARSFNSNPSTRERKITTKVIADNGQTIVLGGLLQDIVNNSDQKVPLLGSIPILGALFRSSSTELTKQHLLVFIRPTIIRDNRKMDAATANKYQFIRNQQLLEIQQGADLLGGDSLPLLPEWEEQLKDLYQQQVDLEKEQADKKMEEANKSATEAVLEESAAITVEQR